MLIKNIFYLTALVFFTIGCGSQSDFISNQEITSNYEIDVIYSTNLIKRELSNNYIKSYPSKDKKNIFVYTKYINGDFTHTYSLLNYDITKSIPDLKDFIIDHIDIEILDVYPLSKNKIIIVYGIGNIKNIYIYDYNLKTKLRLYKIALNEYNTIFTVSTDEKYFFIDNVKIDIQDIYKKEFSLSNIQIYRDNKHDIVIDSINHLIWQDDKSVISQRFRYDNTANICQAQLNYNWRLPTLKDVSTLMRQQTKPFTSPLFKFNINHNETGYWLSSTTTFSDTPWSYEPENMTFYFDYYFNHYDTKYIRCVADINPKGYQDK